MFRRQAPIAQYIEPDYPRLRQELSAKASRCSCWASGIYRSPTLPLCGTCAPLWHSDSSSAPLQTCQDKAKAETGIQLVERWILAPLRDHTFFSLAELTQAIECSSTTSISGRFRNCRALGKRACRQGLSFLYPHLRRLLKVLNIAHGDGSYGRLMRTIDQNDLLILDEQGIQKVTTPGRNDSMESSKTVAAHTLP